MNNTITTSVAFAAFMAIGDVQAAMVSNVQAQQRPKSDVVDVYYDLASEAGGVS